MPDTIDRAELEECLKILKFHAEWDADHTEYWNKEARAFDRGRATMAETLLLMIELDELHPNKVREMMKR